MPPQHPEQTTISFLSGAAQPHLDDTVISRLPSFVSPVQAGFPSPAEDYRGQDLNLHEHLVQNPAATFFARASGDSMINAGIHDGDLLVIDRSIPPENGSVVIAAVAGELTVKRLVLKERRAFLVPENDRFPNIDITGSEDTVIWGVVTHSIHKMCFPPGKSHEP
jgi:DNA polymerase V